MYIGNSDLTATKLLRKRSLRREQHSKLPQATLKKSQAASNFIDKSVQAFSKFDEESKDISSSRICFYESQTLIIRSCSRISDDPNDSDFYPKRPRLLNLALACERTGVSDRSAAMISSSVLQDYGILCADSFEDVIDRNKIRRSRNDIRKDANE